MVGGEGGIRTHVPRKGQDAFEAPPLRPLRYLSVEDDCSEADLELYIGAAPRRTGPGCRDVDAALKPTQASARRCRKNCCTRSRHSSSRTPATTANRWLCPGSSPPRTVDVTAPDFGSAAPKTSVPTRAWTSAPTHIRHGSIVTHSVAPVSR